MKDQFNGIYPSWLKELSSQVPFLTVFLGILPVLVWAFFKLVVHHEVLDSRSFIFPSLGIILTISGAYAYKVQNPVILILSAAIIYTIVPILSYNGEGNILIAIYFTVSAMLLAVIYRLSIVIAYTGVSFLFFYAHAYAMVGSAAFKGAAPYFSLMIITVAMVNIVHFIMHKIYTTWDGLIKQTEAAKAASLEKDRFLANVSHEIRTPLNSIYGVLQVLTSTNIPDKSKELVTIASDSYRTVIALVNDLLDVTKIEHKTLKLLPNQINLLRTITSAVEEHRGTAEHKGIELIVDGYKDIEDFRYFDGVRLKQIIRNLVSNAVKNTTNGYVSVNISANRHSNSVSISVTDTGCGIPADKLPTIYNRFVQGGDYESQSKGLGIGLNIVKELVSIMKGSIYCTSKVGKGTTFTVNLDLPTTLTHHLNKNVEEEFNLCGKTPKVLVVDDSVSNCIVFKAIVSDFCEVKMAYSGDVGAKMALEEEFDLVFLDIQMPVTGFEALKILKDNNYKGYVVACTANVSKKDIDKYLDFGFDNTIAKPLERDYLRDLIMEKVCSS